MAKEVHTVSEVSASMTNFCCFRSFCSKELLVRGKYLGLEIEYFESKLHLSSPALLRLELAMCFPFQ